jgi:hypothetical protein
MSPIYKSGAFIQQCFASHPLCLSIKKLDQPDKIVLTCSSCNMLHRVTLRELTTRLPAASLESEAERAELDALGHLARCFAGHPAALSVRELDVVRDQAALRCAECRRAYDLGVVLIETHQR